jgi:hypothetical protein
MYAELDSGHFPVGGAANQRRGRKKFSGGVLFLPPLIWTAEWVLRVLCAPHRVRASSHEEEALRHFERTQREETR